MPTGSGKTTVAAALAFVLRARRILVITPSRLLREQITEKFETLSDLEQIGALNLFADRPRVKNLDKRVTSEGEWTALEEFDVVVATVFSISGIKNAIPDIPSGLFDLVIVDEAHHTPAATWARALSQLQGAKQVLLTATPFRRDGREIKGKLVFTYDVRRAFEEHVFGDLTFRPAWPGKSESSDEAIARETEAQFKKDKGAGLDHLVMVRVDSLDRAKALAEVYAKTSLRLKFVSGQHALSTVKRVSKALQEGDIDGIICVNMFGEGFDLPRLKIAALHAPHKSLAVTLQFIGRFARTNNPRIGQATFIAYPEEQQDELQELWTSNAVWPEIVHNLSAVRIQREAKAREVFETFKSESAQDFKDLSLTVIQPYFHAKVFRCYDDVDLTSLPSSTTEKRVVFSAISERFNAATIIRQVIRRPRWTTDDRFENVSYQLDIVWYSEKERLLFIGSTEKTISNYAELAGTFCAGKYAELSSATINRALNDIEGLRVFNLGMRRKQFGGRSESYRTLAGPGPDMELSELDGLSYHRGHSFGKGRSGGNDVTIGISTSSKIWSNTVEHIPGYVGWCESLAKKLASRKAKPTGSGLDKLSAGEPIEEFPSKPVYALFQGHTFLHAPSCFQQAGDNRVEVGVLPDFDIGVLQADADKVHLRLSNGEVTWEGLYYLNSFPTVQSLPESGLELFVGRNEEAIPLGDYLTEFPPRLLLDNFDYVEGNTLFDGLRGDAHIDPADIEKVDWDAAKVNIEIEKPIGKEIAARSVFSWLEERLLASDATFVFNDDGSGEIADFIALRTENRINVVTLYHCKASSTGKAGSRLDDLYDVCGQALRSAIWLAGDRILDQLARRERLRSIVGTLKGSLDLLRAAFSPAQRLFLQFEIVIVQPGISYGKLAEGPTQLLLATKQNTRGASFGAFRVICSE